MDAKRHQGAARDAVRSRAWRARICTGTLHSIECRDARGAVVRPQPRHRWILPVNQARSRADGAAIGPHPVVETRRAHPGRILYPQPRPATRCANVADVDEFGLHEARPQVGEARTSLPLPVLSLRGRHHHFRPQQGTDAPLARTHHQNPQNRGLPGARKQDPHPPDQPSARSHRPLRSRLCEFTANVPPTPARFAAHVAVQGR